MGVTLALTAILMLLGHPWVNVLPGGGNELGLTGVKLVIGVIGNFILGALMTAGIGLYAPGMAMVYFLGMSAKVAFPIVMGSCALLMPVASMKFIKEDAYTKSISYNSYMWFNRSFRSCIYSKNSTNGYIKSISNSSYSLYFCYNDNGCK